MEWFKIGKGVLQGCILSPCLFNLYAEYIMRNAGLEEAQAGFKIAGRNINIGSLPRAGIYGSGQKVSRVCPRKSATGRNHHTKQ